MRFGQKLLLGLSSLFLGAAMVSAQTPTTKPAEKIPPMVYHSHNPECEIIIDISDAPYLKEWVRQSWGRRWSSGIRRSLK